MDSRLRTKILYEDPNSIFKSGKKVYLHELQGATLKTTRPTPDDITIGLKGAESMSMLINQLSQLQTIIDFFYTQIYENTKMYATYNVVSARDATKLISSIKALIAKLNKLSPNIFNEDDVFTLLSYHADLTNKLELIILYISNDQDPDYYDVAIDVFFSQRTFVSLLKSLNTLLNTTLVPFIKSINLTGIEGNVSLIQQQLPNIEPQLRDVIPPPDQPIDLPPAEPLEGAGRFRVLSKRILKQQPIPFKRFL